MRIECSLLTKVDIPLMKEQIQEDGSFDSRKLEQFINEPNTYGFIAKIDEKIISFVYCYKLMRPYVGRIHFSYIQ